MPGIVRKGERIKEQFICISRCCSVAQSLRPHGLQHTRLLCPSPSPRACSTSCPLSQWYYPTILSSVVPFLLLPSVFPSTRVFSNELALCIKWPKHWSWSISPSNEYSGLISFRVDSFDLLAVQKILKSLLQHHSSKASILQHSALFKVQLSHPYMTTGKTIALTIWTFVGKIMSLLFNTLSRFVTAFLPRKAHDAAAAAKLLQSCLTLCDPIDGSPPGSPVPGILQARTLEWAAISFSNTWKWSHSVVSDS